MKNKSSKRTHQAVYAIYRRKLVAEWATLGDGHHEPAILRKLMKLAKADIRKRKQIKPVMVFQHSLAGPGCKIRQRYITTNLGRVMLIPPEPYLPMIASGFFYV